ncbi:TPA: DNA cytosine methyltransferase [Stenotrophomonas maltophilia]|uniref:DNA cytosine methyltransferase n=2 Tax=Stenotrophomonas maltophilia TaxID=40324 RepID=UPI003101B2D3
MPRPSSTKSILPDIVAAMKKSQASKPIVAVDLFCGVGGLSYGLKQAGIDVRAGYDLDGECSYAYEANIGAPFICKDVRHVTAKEIKDHFPPGCISLLAGCAPCQPFSSHMRGQDTSKDEKWTLLDEFSRLARAVRPHLITMENVVRISGTDVFQSFVQSLEDEGYSVAYRSCFGPRFGLAQNRRRLVLVASRITSIDPVPDSIGPMEAPTVRQVIGNLPPLEAGSCDASDSLHRARTLTPINLARMRASRPGGTWRDWPQDLLAPCHARSTGASFQSVYARMEWDKPSPTITTQAFNFGTGRFGHPSQDRALTLRESAMLQGFPETYKFVKPNDEITFLNVGRQIGNAVPPPLGKAIGAHFKEHLGS